MSRVPNAFSEPIDGLTFVGRIPRRVAETWGCGELAYQSGEVLFMVEDPRSVAPAARAAIRLRNTALVRGACPSCGELVRPALALAPGAQSGRFAPDAHEPACPASEASIARAVDTDDDDAAEGGTIGS